MFKALFSPTLANAGGWAAAIAVVGAWQYYEAKQVHDPIMDRKEFNQAILDQEKASRKKT